VSSKDQTSTNEPLPENEKIFSGLWNREQVDEHIVHTVDEYRPIQPEVGAVPKRRKGWGIGSFLMTILVFLISQVIIAVPLMNALFANAGSTTNEQDLANSLIEFASNPLFIIISAASMYVVWIGGMFITTYFRGKRSFKKDFKLQFKKWDIFLGLGFAFFLLLFVAFLSWLFSDVFGMDMTGADNGSYLLEQEGAWLLVLALGFATIAGPFFEELFFRGFALQSVIKTAENELNFATESGGEGFYVKWATFWYKARYVSAVAFSSVLFGFMHFQGTETFGQWFVVIVTGSLGVVLGIIALQFKRLGPAIFAHMLYNGGTMVIGLLALNAN
jgi:membrane protease YdiL (CAAX protease family)